MEVVLKPDEVLFQNRIVNVADIAYELPIQCKKCLVQKHRDEFYLRKGTKWVVNRKCKQCHRKKNPKKRGRKPITMEVI